MAVVNSSVMAVPYQPRMGRQWVAGGVNRLQARATDRRPMRGQYRQPTDCGEFQITPRNGRLFSSIFEDGCQVRIDGGKRQAGGRLQGRREWTFTGDG